MTIETKYNIGDEVWLLFLLKPFKSKVYQYTSVEKRSCTGVLSSCNRQCIEKMNCLQRKKNYLKVCRV